MSEEKTDPQASEAPTDPAPPDTTNYFVVSARVSPIAGIRILNPPRREAVLSYDKALNLAAWLVAMTGERDKFLRLLDAVEST